VHLTTEDGSAPTGHPVTRGRVTAALEAHLGQGSLGPLPHILTCGPNPMMKAIVELAHARTLPCLVSVEGEMACGIGACLGCALPLTDGSKPFAYACTDGPVFDAARVVIP
jgi:dihydroorotate dehydrogenase electron transfer subunit